MKIAVVYYSYDGSTRRAAEIISGKFDADIFELEEVKKRGRSPFSFMAAGFSAFFEKRTRLKDTYSDKIKDYENVFIGTPIWAAKPAPAINAFVKALDAGKKQITIFTVQADPDTSNNPKCAANIKTLLDKKGALSVRVVRLCGAPPGKTVGEEDIKKQIDSKLS